MENLHGISVIRHLRKKPDVNQDVLDHFKLTAAADTSQIAMIGDRILSDTVMGNTYGYFTIDCEPFDTTPENFMVKLMRKVETRVIPLISP